MSLTVWSGVQIGPTGRKIQRILNHTVGSRSGYYITSGMDGNHGASSHHYGLSYNGSPTAAVDIGFGYGSKGAATRSRWLCEEILRVVGASNIVELIHAVNPSGYYVKNGRKVGPYAVAAHWNHIHLAMSAAQADRILAIMTAAPPPAPAPEPSESSVSYNDTTKPIFGWDASDFDHDRGMRASHITAAAKEGIRFFTHKVTEGTSVVHRYCGTKLKAADAAGIPFVGAYVVTRTPGNNGHGSISAQVDFAVKTLTAQWPDWDDHPGFFWQVDLEKWPYDSVAAKYGVEMCRILHERTDRIPILYAPRWAYGDNIGGSDPLWNSHYVSGSGPFKSLYPGSNYAGWAPMSGRVPVILQYSSRAVIGGQSTCDANAYRGTEADFAKLINARGDDMPTVSEIWNTDGIIKAPEGASGTDTNPTWAPSSVIRSTNTITRWILEEVRAAKLRDEAVLAAVQGVSQADVLARVDAKAAELAAKVDARADELLAAIAAVAGAPAEEVVRRIGELLSGADS